MGRTMLIIGAGIAGLSVGCYGQMNGYETRIFEQHDLPGGLCTSWKRKGYVFDGCFHWLVGSSPGNKFYRIWEELGAVQGREMVNFDEFYRIERSDGKTLIMYTDPGRLGTHLRELSPADAKIIEEFIASIRHMSKFDMPSLKPMELMNLFDGLKMIPKIIGMGRLFKKYRKMVMKDFGAQFSDPFLNGCFSNFMGMEDFPVLAFLMTLGWLSKKCAGYPIGGSLKFAQAIEERYLKLGGQIHYRSKVTKILTEEGRALGVRLADGTEYRADYVVSAADGHATIFDMLGGSYLSQEYKEAYEEAAVFEPLIQVSLGVNEDFSGLPHMIDYSLKEPLQIAGQTVKELGFRHYCDDPTVAPAGKSVLSVLLNADYDYWERLAQDPEAYQQEKLNVLNSVIKGLEERLPGVSGRIEVTDVATPLTTQRYTGNWRGSFEGWMLTAENMGKNLPRTLSGLSNLYLAGQWVHPGGGVPVAAKSGRDIVQLICKEEKKRFATKLN
jgi:phytoene dehydrogenase-like protein